MLIYVIFITVCLYEYVIFLLLSILIIIPNLIKYAILSHISINLSLKLLQFLVKCNILLNLSTIVLVSVAIFVLFFLISDHVTFLDFFKMSVDPFCTSDMLSFGSLTFGF